MPSTSKSQFRYIQAMRSKYGSRSNAPEDKKWIFDSEWTDVNYDSLPEGIKKYKPLLYTK